MVGDNSFNANLKRNCVARALYDNVAESPDELAFRRGDLLTVLEQNSGGLEGWWLCVLRGRQGICPGNRLRIVPGCYDNGTGLTSMHPVGNSAISGTMPHIQTLRNNVILHRTHSNNKVVTPRRVGDVFTYDIPRSGNTTPLPPNQDYDVPPNRYPPLDNGDGPRLSRSSSLRYDTPRPLLRSSLEQYDTPKPFYDTPRPQQQLYDSPKSYYDTPRPTDHQMCPKSLIKGVRGGSPSTRLNQNQEVNSHHGQQEYDMPRSATILENDSHQPSDRSSVMSCESHLSTSSSASSIPASESLSLSSMGGSSNRSSLESHEVYDVPPEPRRVVHSTTLQNQSAQGPKLPPRGIKDGAIAPIDTYDIPQHKGVAIGRVGVVSTGDVVYDVPPQVTRDVKSLDVVDSTPNRLSSGSDSSEQDLITTQQLPLELHSAKDTLCKLQQEVLCSIEKVTALKKSKDNGSSSVDDVKLIIYRLKEAICEIINFSQGTTGNAINRGELKLSKHITKLMEPVVTVNVVVCDAWQRLRNIIIGTTASTEIALDQLKQVTSVATSLSENIHHLSAFILSNSGLLFKRSPTIDSAKSKSCEDDEKTPVQERPLPALPSEKGVTENFFKNEPNTWLEEYDYVNLESKETIEKEHQDIKQSLPSQLRQSYDSLIKQSHMNVDSDHKKALKNLDGVNPFQTNNKLCSGISKLDVNDQQILTFYGTQSKLHLQHLNTAIDAFLLTIENNQPPKVFIAHSKFVILSAHKLVYIGDTAHRNVVNTEVKANILLCANALCDAMKKTVSAAKTAAIQFPSVTAVQTMVDAFVAVSALANKLKCSLCLDYT